MPDYRLPIEMALESLREFNKKVSDAQTSYERTVSLAVFSIIAAVGAFTGFGFRGGSAFLIAATGLALFVLDALRRRSTLRLASWQLRRVYEITSRLTEAGGVVDFGTQLQMELLLSEAKLLLIRAEGGKFMPTLGEPPNVKLQLPSRDESEPEDNVAKGPPEGASQKLVEDTGA